MTSPRVLVLDPRFQPINEIPLRKAVKLMCRESVDEHGRYRPIAEPVYNPDKPKEDQSFVVRMMGKVFLVPRILRLVRAIRRKMRHSVPLSKKNIMVRDRFTCAYCGTKHDLTIDHVVPISKGGKQSWDNMITACMTCNQKKADRLPNEAGMRLRKQPYQPTISEHLYARLEILGLADVLREVFSS